MRIGGEGATNGATIGYDRGFCFPLCLVNPFVMKPLRQQNRPVISYVPRVEPAPLEHAVKMDHFRDVWILRGKYVAFLLMGSISVAHRHSACRSRRSAGLTRCVRKVRLKPESAAEIKKPLNDQRFFCACRLAMRQFGFFLAIEDRLVGLAQPLAGQRPGGH